MNLTEIIITSLVFAIAIGFVYLVLRAGLVSDFRQKLIKNHGADYLKELPSYNKMLYSFKSMQSYLILSSVDIGWNKDQTITVKGYPKRIDECSTDIYYVDLPRRKEYDSDNYEGPLGFGEGTIKQSGFIKKIFEEHGENITDLNKIYNWGNDNYIVNGVDSLEFAKENIRKSPDHFLQYHLETEIKNENYKLCSFIRDEIKRREINTQNR